MWYNIYRCIILGAIMSVLFSSTIKEDDVPVYKEFRQHLKSKNKSIGTYLIEKYLEEKSNSSIDFGL